MNAAKKLTDMDRIRALADRLAERHGKVTIHTESSGIHLRMASPRAVEIDGRKELKSRHLELNAEKALGLGRYARQRFSGKVRGYAMCMKFRQKYTLEELLAMPELEKRLGGPVAPALVVEGQVERYLVPDELGMLVPDAPGELIPVDSLPQDHPALRYLQARGLDPYLCRAHMRVSYCVTEAPEGREFGNRFYRPAAAGWKSTPQGRIIFESRVQGSRVNWQARYLEVRDPDGSLQAWHPYNRRWETVIDSMGEFVWPYSAAQWPPVKYLTASGGRRNNNLMGLDHVVACQSKKAPGDPRACVLTEGPIDALKFPRHGVALLGKHVSQVQATLVMAYFRRVVTAFDADRSGDEARESAARQLGALGVRVTHLDLNGRHDAGEMSYEEAQEQLSRALA